MTSATVVDASQSLLFRRIFPLLVAVTSVTVVAVTDVPPDLWFLGHGVGAAAACVYAAVMVWLALASAPQSARVHGTASALAVLVMTGRAGGFLELMFELERWNLVGAVLERTVILAGLLIWHQASALEHAKRAELGR